MIETVLPLLLSTTLRYGFVIEYISCKDEEGLDVFISDIFIYDTSCNEENEIVEDSREEFYQKNISRCLDFTIRTYMIESISYKNEQKIIEDWIELRRQDAIRVNYEWQNYCKPEKEK